MTRMQNGFQLLQFLMRAFIWVLRIILISSSFVKRNIEELGRLRVVGKYLLEDCQ